MAGYILYRGSRDELNELCRIKDERIEKLEKAINDIMNIDPNSFAGNALDKSSAHIEKILVIAANALKDET